MNVSKISADLSAALSADASADALAIINIRTTRVAKASARCYLCNFWSRSFIPKSKLINTHYGIKNPLEIWKTLNFQLKCDWQFKLFRSESSSRTNALSSLSKNLLPRT